MKIILVTGATDGIGKKTAELLALKGHQVLVHGRDPKKVEKTVDEIVIATGNVQVNGLVADFIDLKAIEKMVDEMSAKRLLPDILINNAAVFEADYQVLNNGVEKTFMVNYLAPYYLTRLLLSDMLQEKSFPRIINVSSMAQTGTVDFNNLMGKKQFDGYEAYALSKLCNVLFTYYLHRKFNDKGLFALSLHPGVINTKLLRLGWGPGGDETLSGAQREEYAALTEDRDLSGKYLVNNKPSRSAAISYDERIQDRLWNISAQLCGLA
jgi:NAD(P)-dependent dehydrogenase (short-subunit alcohol dehydrogenase family)